ncbi:RTA1 like protein-domain-containing protein [Desarmillaria tabescens]|uniref:RTA1 like protein-domain-containing protein n=1 Tax=Armillaria tabescens TaxID=1929756 RepID=A0AA39KFQ3_ARMTA|nr:RTA1 like protein-domain-containing protein [Desarmillaria tabescens]KAK0460255.1 RTA1 like protein-domain-containing protein [Desarmillaria tabescens]
MDSAAFISRLPISLYGYVPEQTDCIVFLVLFSVSTALHFVQAIAFRQLWVFPTIFLCGVAEIIGWSCRLWSYNNVFLIRPFEVQYFCLMIAPVFLFAANIVIFVRIVQRLGPWYSPLKPRYYLIIFAFFAVVAAIVMTVGLGVALGAVPGLDLDQVNTGVNVVLAGVAIHLFALVLYLTLSGFFFIRHSLDLPSSEAVESSQGTIIPRSPWDKQVLVLSLALMFDMTCILVRTIYRTLELSYGIFGRYMVTERFVVAMDAAMMVAAMVLWNLVHPALFMKRRIAIE